MSKVYGLKVSQLKVGCLYIEIVSGRLVLIVQEEQGIRDDTSCKAKVYNRVLGKTVLIEVRNYELCSTDSVVAKLALLDLTSNT